LKYPVSIDDIFDALRLGDPHPPGGKSQRPAQ
jgi:hypothetical protein